MEEKPLVLRGASGTLEEANFPAESFDAIVMGGVIEHLYDPGSTLQQISLVLRPRGWLYFDAPNEDGLYMRAGNAYMRMCRRDWVVSLAPTFSPYHVQGFNPASVKKILERNNYAIEDFRIFGDIQSADRKTNPS